MFVSFDGIDGVGKTTQIERFTEWLQNRGHQVAIYRDPGSTELSERIRDILLAKSEMPIAADAEMMLYMTARTELVREKIEPDLKAGVSVVTDRYLLATLAYQGHAGNVSLDAIRTIGRFATMGRYPDLTFLLDLSPEESLRRRQREPDRMEERGLLYMKKVREGFLIEAANDPTIHVIDANRPIDDVADSIQAIASRFLQDGEN